MSCLLFCCAVAGAGWSPLFTTAHAQEVEAPEDKVTRHSSALWLSSYTKYRLNDKLFYYGEYHFRRRNNLVRDMAQIYLRFGLTYRPSDEIELTGGVVTPFYWSPPDRTPDTATVVPQFRFWEQAVLGQVIDRVRLYHQFRFEQRWRRDYERGSPFLLTFRWRYRISGYVPLNNRRMVKGTWFLSAYDEVIIQTGRSITYDPFEDNRLFIGAGYVLNRNVTIQAGYMWTYRHDNAPNAFEHRHVPRISIYHNLDLRELLRK